MRLNLSRPSPAFALAPTSSPRLSSSFSLSTGRRRPQTFPSRRRPAHLSMSSRPILALDFDGVLCDSVHESTLTGIRAAFVVWPLLTSRTPSPSLIPPPAPALINPSSPPPWLVSSLTAARPVVETGFEILLLARALIAAGPGAAHAFVENLLKAGTWPDDRDALMAQWAVGKDELIAAFGGVRDAWIDADVDAWLGANAMFPGVVGALNGVAGDVFIITTKEARFAAALLEKNGVVGLGDDRIFGLGSGSKVSVLKKILAMPEAKGREVVFVEDRYETLEKVSLSMLGEPLELLLAKWGYNTEKTRETAEFHPFISAIDLDAFVERLEKMKAE